MVFWNDPKFFPRSPLRQEILGALNPKRCPLQLRFDGGAKLGLGGLRLFLAALISTFIGMSARSLKATALSYHKMND